VVDIEFFHDLGALSVPPIAVMAAQANSAAYVDIAVGTGDNALPGILPIYGSYGVNDADNVAVGPLSYNSGVQTTDFFFVAPVFTPRSASISFNISGTQCQLNGAVFISIPAFCNYTGGGSYSFAFALTSSPAYSAQILLRSNGYANGSIVLNLTKPSNATQDSIAVSLGPFAPATLGAGFDVTYPGYMAYQANSPCQFGQPCTIDVYSLNTDLSFAFLLDGPVLYVSAYNGWFTAFFDLVPQPLGATSALSMTSTYSYSCTDLQASFYD